MGKGRMEINGAYLGDVIPSLDQDTGRTNQNVTTERCGYIGR